MKRMWALVLVLVMVAAACGGGDEETDGSTTATEATGGTEAAQGDTEGTLATVLARGSLNCGVSTTAIGFAEPQDDGSYNGFDADFCRALAAALFNDATAVTFVGTTAAERFTVLANGGVDVLFRTTTWTQKRDTEIGGDFGPTTFYDGQQVMGKADRGFDSSSTLGDVDGATLCTNAGTTTESNITEGAKALGAIINLTTVEAFADAMDLFRAGSCDLVTTDGSGLFGERFSAVEQGEIADGEWVIFPTQPISKEPLGPMYRANDSQWADVVNWLVYALIIADEYGITAANVDAMVADPPDGDSGRMLGATEDNLQVVMGLTADAWANAIRATGNYDEIYTRNLGPLGFDRAGTPNARWTEGGLQYAPPPH